MSNMAYCRFEKTLNDFNDCVENIYSLNENSTKYEFESRRELIFCAIRLLTDIGIDDLKDTDKIKECINWLNEP